MTTCKHKCNERISLLAEDMTNKINHELVEKTKGLFKDVCDFIKSKKLIIYGGFAINELLRKKKLKGIYDNSEIKDIDCYSNNAIDVSKELVNFLIKKGYKYVEMKQAFLSEDTFKVFAEYVSVCDITSIDLDTFNKYSNTSVKYNGFLLQSPIMLLKSLTFELSQPKQSYFRWEKLFSRFHIMNNAYGSSEHVKKLQFIKFSKEQNPKIKEILNEILKYCKQHGIPIIGTVALQLHMHSKISLGQYNTKMSYIHILDSSPIGIIEMCKNKYGCKIIKQGDIIEILYKDVYILDIFVSENTCTSICNIAGYKVVTLFGIMYFLYHELFANIGMYVDDIKHMLYLTQKCMKTKNCKNNCLIGLECYGTFDNTVINIMKSRWNKRIIRYRPNSQNRRQNIKSIL